MKSLRILSLGAGVQSTTLLHLALAGEIPRPDYAIFADTGWESMGVYGHLFDLEEASTIPVETVSAGNIRDDCLSAVRGKSFGFASMPFFTPNGENIEGRLRRQCTREYKIEPITKKIRELLGVKRVTSQRIELQIGISLDEMRRCKKNRVPWITNTWPLIDLRMTRRDCRQWLEMHGKKIPQKSSCIGCPYHDDQWWVDCRENSPLEWQDAVSFDQQIRHLPRIKSPCYLHRSLLPLDEAIDQASKDNGQKRFPFMLAECEGMCGV